MALAPWNVLAAGRIRTDAEEQRRIESGEGGRSMFADWKRNEKERQVCLALEKVAAEIGAKSITSGTQLFPMFNLRLTRVGSSTSRDRILDAKSPLRLPHHRRTEGGAPPREPRSSRDRAHEGAHQEDPGRRAVRPWLPEPVHRECSSTLFVLRLCR